MALYVKSSWKNLKFDGKTLKLGEDAFEKAEDAVKKYKELMDSAIAEAIKVRDAAYTAAQKTYEDTIAKINSKVGITAEEMNNQKQNAENVRQAALSAADSEFYEAVEAAQEENAIVLVDKKAGFDRNNPFPAIKDLKLSYDYKDADNNTNTIFY